MTLAQAVREVSNNGPALTSECRGPGLHKDIFSPLRFFTADREVRREERPIRGAGVQASERGQDQARTPATCGRRSSKQTFSTASTESWSLSSPVQSNATRDKQTTQNTQVSRLPVVAIAPCSGRNCSLAIREFVLPSPHPLVRTYRFSCTMLLVIVFGVVPFVALIITAPCGALLPPLPIQRRLVRGRKGIVGRVNHDPISLRPLHVEYCTVWLGSVVVIQQASRCPASFISLV